MADFLFIMVIVYYLLLIAYALTRRIDKLADNLGELELEFLRFRDKIEGERK